MSSQRTGFGASHDPEVAPWGDASSALSPDNAGPPGDLSPQFAPDLIGTDLDDLEDSLPTDYVFLGKLLESKDAGMVVRFLEYYWKRIQTWCLQNGLSEEDAHDSAQDICLTIRRRVATYRHKPGQKFKDWLFIVTRNAVIDRHKKKRLPLRPLLDDPVARHDDSTFLERETRLMLIRQAYQILQDRQKPADGLKSEKNPWNIPRLNGSDGSSHDPFEVFDRIIKGDSVNGLAGEIKVNRNAIDKSKFLIKAKIRKIVDEIGGES